MKKKLSLRPLTEEDLPKILAIEQQVHVAPWSEKNIRTELEKPYSQFLVLTDDETDSEIMGYIVFWFLFDECQILNVAIGEPYRRQGLAKFMIRKAVQLAYQKGIKKVTLDVRKSNMPAIQLYQQLQFYITHIRKSFYSNGEDAYQMVLNLTDDPFQF